MNKIISPLSKRERVCTSSGNRYRIEYVRVDEPDGRVWLKEVGKVDIREEINSNRPIEVSSLINRYMRGDRTALGDPTGAYYGDTTGIGSLEDVVDFASTVEFKPVAESVKTDVPVAEKEVKADAES